MALVARHRMSFVPRHDMPFMPLHGRATWARMDQLAVKMAVLWVTRRDILICAPNLLLAL